MDDRPESFPGKPMSRRELLIKLGVAGAGTALAYKAGELIYSELQKGIPSKSKVLHLNNQPILTESYKPEEVILPDINWYPDGHTSFIKTPQGTKVWLAGGSHGYQIEATSVQTINQSKPREVIVPTGKETFDRDYAAPGSVVEGSKPGEYLMFYHGEYHPKAPSHFPFNSGIGLATSRDGGKNWERQGQILKGQNEQSAKDRVYGAGQPCAILRENYIYLYFIDWNGQYPDSIHLARSPISANGSPNSWEKFYNGVFRNEGMNGRSSPVIKAEAGDYSALPSISWNYYLNSYLAVYETRTGFKLVTSQDGIEWSKPESLMNVQTINNRPEIGQKWNSYPTLWSPEMRNDRETNQKMLLIYSEGVFQQTPHSMRIKAIKFS